MSWRDNAACRGMDAAVFFEPENVPEARWTCASCPVRTECAAAGAGEAHGVWGGELPWQRGVRAERDDTVHGECVICGAPIVVWMAHVGGQERKYCGGACARRASYLRRRVSRMAS